MASLSVMKIDYDITFFVLGLCKFQDRQKRQMEVREMEVIVYCIVKFSRAGIMLLLSLYLQS